MMNALGKLIVTFFEKYLINEKGNSNNTVESYGNCLHMLLDFCCTKLNVEIDKLSLADLTQQMILSFLDHLEQERCNCAKTRNQRLAAIKCFCRFAARRKPVFLANCRQICEISDKKTEHKIVKSLTKSEVKAILEMPDTRTKSGARDFLLLSLLYNTGARVQELCDLKIEDISTGKLKQVLLTGKGQRQRTIPLWDETYTNLENYLVFRPDAAADEYLFLNAQGLPITRAGISYIVKKYSVKAAIKCPTLKGRTITPHKYRHTTALHLIQSGVDITVVKEWLGHRSINTTMVYVHINTEEKRKALEKYPAPTSCPHMQKTKWKQQGIREFLKDLCKH